MKIGQHDLPDLVRYFLFYQLDPSSDIEPDDLPLNQCPVLWDSRVSVFHSATATFHAPSNPSGPGGMYREVIHSPPLWTKGDISGPRRDCVFVDGGGGRTLPVECGACSWPVFTFSSVSHLLMWSTLVLSYTGSPQLAPNRIHPLGYGLLNPSTSGLMDSPTGAWVLSTWILLCVVPIYSPIPLEHPSVPGD